MLKLIPVLISAALVLGGCATEAQMRAGEMSRTGEGAFATRKACMTTVFNSNEFTPLQAHMPVNVTQATLEQLSDSRLITEVEARAVFKVHPRIQECRRYYLDHISSAFPTIVPIMAGMYAKDDTQLVQLVQKKISWGLFTSSVRANSAEAEAQIATEYQRINAGLQQSHEAEMARRQAAANAMAAYAQQQQIINNMNAQQQQIINNMNRPVVTNCNAYGNSVNCVTQ